MSRFQDLAEASLKAADERLARSDRWGAQVSLGSYVRETLWDAVLRFDENGARSRRRATIDEGNRQQARS